MHPIMTHIHTHVVTNQDRFFDLFILCCITCGNMLCELGEGTDRDAVHGHTCMSDRYGLVVHDGYMHTNGVRMRVFLGVLVCEMYAVSMRMRMRMRMRVPACPCVSVLCCAVCCSYHATATA